jgi:hypothetical protein
MALPSEVQKTIRSIDKKIAELQEMRTKLIETFGGVAMIPQPRPATAMQITQIPSVRTRVKANDGMQRFKAFLQTHGPATTLEVVTGAQIPRGSVSWLISKSSGEIRRRDDGKIELAS